MEMKSLTKRLSSWLILLAARPVDSFSRSSPPRTMTIHGVGGRPSGGSPRDAESASTTAAAEAEGERRDRPRKESRRLVLIRHGLSYMNEHIGSGGVAFGGPNFTDVFPPEDREAHYRDSPLSPTGREQAERLGRTIEGTTSSERQARDWSGRGEPLDELDETARAALEELELVVVSPLARAIQTAELALKSRIDRDAIPVVASPLAAERLYLVSDVGRTRADLEARHGDWVDFRTGFSIGTTDDSEGDDDAPWWYQPGEEDSSTLTSSEWRPSGEGQSYFCPGEPHGVFGGRMNDLCDWLADREESTIALVGHHGVFEWLLQKGGEGPRERVEFANCEVRVVPLDATLDNARRRRRKQ